MWEIQELAGLGRTRGRTAHFRTQCNRLLDEFERRNRELQQEYNETRTERDELLAKLEERKNDD